MNQLQRSVKVQNMSTKSRLASAQTGKKLTIYVLAILIVSAMIAWFGFLGWGFVAILHKLLDCTQNLWQTYF
jgi:hypothetical protein